MPIYEYECNTCHHATDEFQFMSEAELTTCPECGGETYQKRPSLPHSDMVEFHKPIELLSIALNHDDEIREFQKAAPDVPIETDPRSEHYGIPIAKSRKQKLQALEAAGFVEKK